MEVAQWVKHSLEDLGSGPSTNVKASMSICDSTTGEVEAGGLLGFTGRLVRLRATEEDLQQHPPLVSTPAHTHMCMQAHIHTYTRSGLIL